MLFVERVEMKRTETIKLAWIARLRVILPAKVIIEKNRAWLHTRITFHAAAVISPPAWTKRARIGLRNASRSGDQPLEGKSGVVHAPAVAVTDRIPDIDAHPYPHLGETLFGAGQKLAIAFDLVIAPKAGGRIVKADAMGIKKNFLNARFPTDDDQFFEAKIERVRGKILAENER